jgi:hypothetical protein
MLTYVVTLTHSEFHEYCRKRGLAPSAARLVRSKADLQGVEIGNDRIVFYGRCYELPNIQQLLEYILDSGAHDTCPRRRLPVYELRRA